MTNPSQPSPYSPPPPPQPAARVAVPAVGWLVPLAALLGVVGLFTPWFDPSGSQSGAKVLEAESALYSWQDGKIGLIAPILLVVVAIGVGALLLGRNVSRFNTGSHGPVFSAGRTAMIAGGVTLVAVLIAWFLVPGQFKIPSEAGGSWDGAAKAGIDMTRGPQIGYWLTVIAGVLALVGGLLMILMRSRTTTPDPSTWAPAGQPHGGQTTPDHPGPSGQAPAWGQPAQPGPAWGQPPAPAQQQPSGPAGQPGATAPYGAPDGQQTGRHGA